MKWNLASPSEKNIKRDTSSQEAVLCYLSRIPVSQSLSIHPFLIIRRMMMNMREGEKEEGREGGRRGIIPSEYMMNVVIGFKLTWGRVVHRDRESACE